eukprot:1608950-Rhodomonas_salina.3
MSGTDLAYTSSAAVGVCVCYAMPLVPSVWWFPSLRLRARYAMPGTDLAWSAVGICVCYAMPGADLAYCATNREEMAKK